MYWFTSDQHFGHTNIIKYCKRPFKDADEMDAILINNFNKLVKPGDTTIHAGDFTLKKDAAKYIERLNGKHIFLKGSHDYWQQIEYPTIWEKKIDGIYVVVCHYPFKSWPRSFHGSINLHGHCHGMLEVAPNQYDIGVDSNDYKPVNLKQILSKMKKIWKK
jgi:calcineurin-like phosphoesterase family protein